MGRSAGASTQVGCGGRRPKPEFRGSRFTAMTGTWGVTIGMTGSDRPAPREARAGRLPAGKPVARAKQNGQTHPRTVRREMSPGDKGRLTSTERGGTWTPMWQ